MSDVTTLMTLDEVAEHLHVSRRTVERHVEAGRIRTVAIGRSIRVTSREFEAYVASAARRAS